MRDILLLAMALLSSVATAQNPSPDVGFRPGGGMFRKK